MIINSNIKAILEERSKKLEPSHIEIGLLVGQENESNEQQTYILGVFPTPIDMDLDSNKPIYIESIQSIDKEWVKEYCTQVLRMLYGGLTIVGIYMIIPEHEILNEKDNDTFLMKLFKHLDKDLKLFNSIQFISFSKKTNLINGKSTTSSLLYRLKSTELKVVDNLESEFITLNCNIPIEIKLKSKKDSVEISSNYHPEIALGNIFENQLFKQSIMLIENDQYNENDIISTVWTSPNKTKLQIDFLIDQLKEDYSISSYLEYRPTSQTQTQYQYQFQFQFNSDHQIHCIAFIHRDQQIKNIFNFIKQDIINSMKTRFNVLYDQTIQECLDLKLTSNQSIELPRRAKINWLSNGITICDYLTLTNTIEDCKKSVTDLLQITSPTILSIESSLKLNNQQTSTPQQKTSSSSASDNNETSLNKQKHQQQRQSHLQQTQRQPQPNNSYAIVFVITIIVLILAIYFK